MKSRNIKTRLAAFGLALLMGLSPLGNLADVHAAESEISQNAVTEKESKTESEHQLCKRSETDLSIITRHKAALLKLYNRLSV